MKASTKLLMRGFKRLRKTLHVSQGPKAIARSLRYIRHTKGKNQAREIVKNEGLKR